MAFYTEKQTETWLQNETRHVKLPDGTVRAVTAFRLTWSKADSLVVLNGHALSELAAYAAEESSLQNITLDHAFHCVIAWLDEQRRDRWGL